MIDKWHTKPHFVKVNGYWSVSNGNHLRPNIYYNAWRWCKLRNVK